MKMEVSFKQGERHRRPAHDTEWQPQHQLQQRLQLQQQLWQGQLWQGQQSDLPRLQWGHPGQLQWHPQGSVHRLKYDAPLHPAFPRAPTGTHTSRTDEAPGEMLVFSVRSHGFAVPRNTSLAALVTEAQLAALSCSTSHCCAEAAKLLKAYEWFQWESYERLVVRRKYPTKTAPKEEMIISKDEMKGVQKSMEVLLRQQREGRRHRRLRFEKAWKVDDEDVPVFYQSPAASEDEGAAAWQAPLEFVDRTPTTTDDEAVQQR